MTRAALIALLLATASAPVLAAGMIPKGPACYDPGIVSGCPMHCTGSQGGGHCAAENCHKLPDCPKR